MNKVAKFLILCAVPWVIAMAVVPHGSASPGDHHDRVRVATATISRSSLDRELRNTLRGPGSPATSSARSGSGLQKSLGRPVDQQLAELGRLLWFDNLHSRGRDNTCGGCHSPTQRHGRFAADGHRRPEQPT